MNDQVILVDVAPRDGIQNEKLMLTAAQKLELIRRLAAAGMCWIEVASFASPKWVPQMADAEEVFGAASKIPGIRPIVLVLNDRGYDRAVAAGARHIRLVVAATDTMNLKNANARPGETMASYRPIFERAARRRRTDRCDRNRLRLSLRGPCRSRSAASARSAVRRGRRGGSRFRRHGRDGGAESD